eukprot:448382_1
MLPKVNAIKQSNERIRFLLKTNRLLSNVNDIVINRCFDSIMQLFGGYQQVLLTIAKSSNLDQLKSMHSIITEQHRKYQNEQSVLKRDHDIDDNDIRGVTMRKFTFSTLPNECIGHVCGYLDKSDISFFKRTSAQISIVCLEEMEKISVGTWNINHCIGNDTGLYHMEFCYMINWARENSKKRYYSLYEE